jgi:hypothetical protein
MNRLNVRLAAAAASLLFSNLIAAQVSPYAPKTIPPPAPTATHVRITQGPELELAYTNDNSTAQSHIRLNRNHPYTVFRVRVEGLQPKTTYYYTVDSTQATGKSDGVKSPVKSFSMP